MMAREQAEHFCPLKPKAEATTPIHGGVEIGIGADED